MKIKKAKADQYPKKVVTLDGMDLYSLCRWASLKEAVDIVADKCEEKNIEFERFDLKPLDLLKYVDSMTDDLYYKVMNEEKEVNTLNE
jgi:hypothetical protein